MRCQQITPIASDDRVPFSRDIDDALFCTDAHYAGPDAFPFEAMIASAFRELARVYPTVPAAIARDHGPVGDIRSLTLVLMRMAAFARVAIPVDVMARTGNPEHILIHGALKALRWRTDFVPSRSQPFPPPAADEIRSATPRPRTGDLYAIVEGDIAFVRGGQLGLGMSNRIRIGLRKSGHLRGVILDLRGSPGGLLSESLLLADLFTRNQCIAITRTTYEVEPRQAHDDGDDVDAPLVVLIDSMTSSGAELVAASLRASGRALLVGERTFGAGVINVVLDLGSGGQLSVAIGELTAGDGSPILGRGVEPDLAVPVDFSAGTGGDPGEIFAHYLLLHTNGNTRSDLLRAAGNRLR